MEPLGATAAILQLIDVALKTTSKVYSIYRVFRDSKDIHERVQREMFDLVRVLNQLLDATQDDELPDRLKLGHVQVLRKLLTGKDSRLSHCIDEVVGIGKLLEAHSSISWPVRKREIDQRLSKIASVKEELSFAIQTQSMATVLDIRRILDAQGSNLQQLIQTEANKATLAWLDPPDVWKNFQNAILKWQPGTGEWLMRTHEYEHWKRNPGCLWLSGMPGAGKTIMSSAIVASLLENHRASASAVVYSYFDFSSESQQEAQSFLRACLAQLAARAPEAFDFLIHLRIQCSKDPGQQPTLGKLLEATVAAMGCFPEVFFVVDALDECSQRKQLLKILKWLESVPNLHLALLSRREQEIDEALSAWAQELPLKGIQVDKDIEDYIQQRISNSSEMQEWSEEDRLKVKTQVKEMAGGMFRWVQCQLDSLEQCIDSDEVDEILASLPSDLPSTYERMLIKLEPTSAKRVRHVLLALAFARRPLRVDEVVNMLSISTTDDRPRMKNRTKVYPKQLLSFCSSLVSISTSVGGTDKQEMRLAHASVKDYLVSNHLRDGPASAFYTKHGKGHLLLAAKGVACLLDQNDVSRFGPHTLEEVPFLQYSALNWVHHAKEANPEPDRGSLDDLIFALLHREDEAYVNWHRITGRFGPAAPVEGYAWDIHIQDSGKFVNDGRPASKEALLNGHHINRPLHHATHWNLWRVVERLLDADHDPKALSKGNRSALHYGAMQRSLESMDLILKRGVDIDIGDWIGDTPSMYCVSKARDPVTMEFLMKHGARLSHVSRRSGNLLQCAAMEGDPDVLETILKKMPQGISTDIGSDQNHNEVADLATPLQCAAYGGRLECIKLLLTYGADIRLDRGKMGSPLHAAAAAGKYDAFELLLQRGADINATKGQYGSVLWAAGYGSNRDCIRVCLERGLRIQDPEIVGLCSDKNWRDYPPDKQEGFMSAIIRAAGDRHCRDIFDAARRGMTSRVEAFLNNSQNRRSEMEKTQEIHGRTPLSWAAGEGHIDTVKYLAKQGANPNTWGRSLQTPLEIACLVGNLDMVKCLLAVGSETNFRQEEKYLTAIICADMSGNKELVEFLRELDGDRTVTFEFEGQVYQHDGDMHYRLKPSQAFYTADDRLAGAAINTSN